MRLQNQRGFGIPNKICQTYRKNGLRVNWKKTKTKLMDMQGKVRKPIMVAWPGGDKEVPFVQEVEYLGRYFAVGGGGDEAVRRRLQKAWKVFWDCKRALCNKAVPFVKRYTYLCRTVGAVATYGLESVELSRQQLNMLRTARRQMMRKMRSRRWGAVSDRVNYDVWVKMETQRAEEAARNLGVTGWWEESVAVGKFKWAGHMVRRGSERRTQRVIMAQETQKRASAGHPKKRWHNIIDELQGRGWQETAEDREWWRYFSNEVPNWIATILD